TMVRTGITLERSRRTTKMGQAERRPAQKEMLRLIVDYDGADDFLADYDSNLAKSTLHVDTPRAVTIGTIIELGLAFPGLLQSIVLDALVQQVHENGLALVLLEDGGARLKTIAERVRERDPKVVSPVVNVLIVEDNKHVCDLVRQGLAGSARREM